MIVAERWMDYVHLLQHGFDETRKQRAEWWQTYVHTRTDAAYMLVALVAYNALLIKKLTPTPTVGPLAVRDDMPPAHAYVRRVLNAHISQDRTMSRELYRLLLDAMRGDHGEAGQEYAADVVESLDRMAATAIRSLGWAHR